MKKIFLIMLYSLIIQNINSQIIHFWNQTQIDTFTDYLSQRVYIWNKSDIDDPIVNLKPLMTMKWQAVERLEIFNTSVTEIDFTGVKHNYLEYLRIYSNKDLKTIKGLNKLVNYLNIAIDTNDNLESISFQFDTLNSGSLIHVRNNSKLQTIDVKFTTDFYYSIFDPYYTNFIGYGHGMYIANNPSLRKVSYSKTKGDGRLSRFFVLNNTSLDSVIINKVNPRRAVFVREVENSDRYKSSFSSINGFNSGGNYNAGVRIDFSNNDSLRYIGNGWENDSFSLVSLRVKNNKNLSDLCILKKKILEFPNPQSNLSLLYDISNNAPGANSISEVVSGECKKTTPIRDITVVQNSIAVWPNPASSYLSVTLPDDNVYDVTFVNSVGQEVWRGKVSNEQQMIPVANFSKGLYLVSFKGKTLTQALKCMIE